VPFENLTEIYRKQLSFWEDFCAQTINSVR